MRLDGVETGVEPDPTSPHGIAVLNAALESDEAALVSDDVGRFVAANTQASVLLGYSVPELLELSLWNLTPEGNEVDGTMLFKEFLEIGYSAGIYWLVRKDGSTVALAYRAIARVLPGRHLSRFGPVESLNQPFERSRLLRG